MSNWKKGVRMILLTPHEDSLLFANYFESTHKSIVNVSALILKHLQKNNCEQKLEKLFSSLGKELKISYEKNILALNFLYMLGVIEYDKENNTIRMKDEIK